MEKVYDFLKRNGIWIIIGIIGIILLNPSNAEIKTLLIILVVESLAVALSGTAVYAYTKIDFTSEEAKENLGIIFLGVHICTGLVILGVYIAQFGL